MYLEMKQEKEVSRTEGVDLLRGPNRASASGPVMPPTVAVTRGCAGISDGLPKDH